jgi:hypothetical protein
MAAIPCKFLYKNVEKYFKGELDDKTKQAWEKTLRAENKRMNNSNDDWLFSLPIISAFIAGRF